MTLIIIYDRRDKTSYLKNIFATKADVMLFTRPRRFGKTLNMSMIESFVKLNYQNPNDKTYQEKLFLDNGYDLAVAKDEYRDFRAKFMGDFPVISFSFKGINGSCYLKAIAELLKAIGYLYAQFEFLKDSTKLSVYDRNSLKMYLDFCCQRSLDLYQRENLFTAESLANSFLYDLGSMLHKEFGRNVIILIDEYDVPLQKSLVAEEPYYNKMLEIIRAIFEKIFKQGSNSWLAKGIVTGCLRIAHQSIFTGANNFNLYGINDNRYAGFFGFTYPETKKLLEESGFSSYEGEVRKWYDGYRVGDEHLFCPWSVSLFCHDAIQDTKIGPKPYWINSSGNDIIKLYLEYAVDDDLSDEIELIQKLLQGEFLEISLREFNTYPDLTKRGIDFDIFMTLFLQTGYLTFTDDSPLQEKVRLRIPNLEIQKCFKTKIDEFYTRTNPIWVKKAKELLKNLLTNQYDDARIIIDNLLGTFISIRDTGNEFFYHGFIQGVLSLVVRSEGVILESEVDTGNGYSDIILDKSRSKTAVILELKKGGNSDGERINAANAAVQQIININYAQKFISRGYKKIFALGIGFGGKTCEVKSLGNLAKSAKK